MTLDDPEVVRRDYSSEARLLARRAVYESSDGPDAREVVWRHAVAAGPRDVLEVGPGPGELSERMARELGANVIAIDISPRMVELTRARGVEALVGDVQELPFDHERFDAVVAAWVLFHPADLTAALAEIARVLRPTGRLVAATNSEEHLGELWQLVGGGAAYAFSAENGAALLEEHFASVAVDLVEGWVEFESADAARQYVASSIVCSHLAERVPDFEGSLRARRKNAIFVAEKA